MNIHGRPVRAYRWIVFLLAVGYTIYNVVTSDYTNFGGPFRFLTIWGLIVSMISAYFMLSLSSGWRDGDYRITAMSASVLNVMVMFLYWKLYFTDPNLLHADGPPPFLQQYYLHLAGPFLQIFDALFIARVYRRPLRAVPQLMAIIMAYVAWGELVIQNLNDSPAGSVTSGLAYPFLNSMTFPERGVFYASNAGIALVILAGFAALSWVLRLNRA
ncbi:androgen-induced gene 1 family protein [Actibacterium pelagium]|uniref:FAR-17a/AIG1-like protein n=1 Tax=Actibacterium pelagium TaxID=2029103 RepID=A0A917AI07_9RHOB|nr:hypothetical protein [Actibacterium pelagium]GGE53006.1 hypothetical protein GCM10011517_21000 [Actibacterium pelagium]